MEQETRAMVELHLFTGDNFQLEVLQSDTPVLVDFTAEWCGPCHMLAPVVEKLNAEWNGAVKVGQLDADANADLVMQYGVMGLPTLILFKNGQPVERLAGYMRRERILSKLQPHLS
jgi:thioredoxin 1